MARRKKEDHVRSITKTAGGKSYSVTLPITIVRALEWDAKRRVCIRKWGRKIIIEDMEIMEEENRSC